MSKYFYVVRSNKAGLDGGDPEAQQTALAVTMLAWVIGLVVAAVVAGFTGVAVYCAAAFLTAAVRSSAFIASVVREISAEEASKE